MNGKSEKKKNMMSGWDWAFVICNTTFLVLFCIVTLYPILNTLAVSFNDGLDAVKGGIHLIPRKFSLRAYDAVIHKQGLQQGAIVTVARTVIGTLLALAANALLAFVVSRRRFLFRSSLSFFWVVTMYASGGMIPGLILMKNLHLTNSFLVYIIPGLVSAFNVLVLRTYMESLPDSYEESAQLDGAGYMRIFVSIISPLCKPVYATVALFVAVGHWNSWFDAMLYNRNRTELTTLQYELQKYLNSVMQTQGNTGSGGKTSSSSQVTPVTVRAAASIVTMLPIIMLYPFLQRYFVTGLTIGGVKE